jgi:hypothetical protein
VVDADAPVIIGVVASTDVLWPPNGSFVSVTLAVNATDNCDASVACAITNVTSSEPITGSSDNTSPDWIITGPLSLNLRAERSDSGPGRVYTITVKCTDFSGNSATKSLTVTAPHDLGRRSKGEL